jgi:hypothetical protein
MAVGSRGEVEGVVAVEMDVLVGEQRDVLDLAGRDQLAASAELVEDALGVDGVPDDDRVDDDREAERLLALLLGGPLANVAFVGVEDRAAKRVELLALVGVPLTKLSRGAMWPAGAASLRATGSRRRRDRLS